jgi:hypothetical protein
MTIQVIEGTLVYAKIAQDAFKYQSDVAKEYSVGIIIDEDAADTWNEVFQKQPAKKIKVADFEAKFKFECPIKNVKNVYVINLKKASVDKDGNVMDVTYRPKVFLDTEDGTRADITTSRLIANGTYAKVSYYVSENKDYGTLARLQNILIQESEFVEYEQQEKSVAGNEFGGDAPKATIKEADSKGATQARDEKPRNVSKPKGKTMDVDDFDNSDDSPF